jgi:hypothetical protein
MKHSVLAMAALLSAAGFAQPQTPAPQLIEGRRPVSEARRRLQPLYGQVITYEEPFLSWKDELQPLEQGPRMMPKVRRFLMPAEATSAPSVSVALEKTLDAYHQQVMGTRFRVLTSKLGYHIVPVQARNEHGDLVPAASLLDAQIFVPIEERTPEQHLEALGAAVTSATGINFLPAAIPLSPDGFDLSFQWKPKPFRWGAEAVVARDALIDLLDRGASTYSWDLTCTASAVPSDRACILTISFLKVAITDAAGQPSYKVLIFDKCGECPASERTENPLRQ